MTDLWGRNMVDLLWLHWKCRINLARADREKAPRHARPDWWNIPWMFSIIKWDLRLSLKSNMYVTISISYHNKCNIYTWSVISWPILSLPFRLPHHSACNTLAQVASFPRPSLSTPRSAIFPSLSRSPHGSFLWFWNKHIIIRIKFEFSFKLFSNSNENKLSNFL